MINEKQAKRYCCEDISLIENYNDAIKSPEIWDCHHRLETDLGLSAQELMDTNRYDNVEAKYLIFLTHREHTSLHTKGVNHKGENNPMYGVHKYGKEHPRYGTHHSEESKQKMRKPKKKFKWLTTEGEIKIMPISNVKCWHPDWKLIE